MSLIQNIKPSVSRHNLLFIAGLAWTTAGGHLRRTCRRDIMESVITQLIE